MMTSSTTSFRRSLGDAAEQMAVEHLLKNGYQIRDRNVQMRMGELDVVAERDDGLVVVEVRMKSNDSAGEPSETVMFRKQRKVALATAAYLQQQNLECVVRFDVISVLGHGHSAEIEHIEDAFEAGF